MSDINVTISNNPDDHPIIDVGLTEDTPLNIDVVVSNTPSSHPIIEVDVLDDPITTINVDITESQLSAENILVDLNDWTGTIHNHNNDYYLKGETYSQVEVDGILAGYYDQTEVDNIVDDYLPLAGGSMTGAINLGGNDITNIGNDNGSITIGDSWSAGWVGMEHSSQAGSAGYMIMSNGSTTLVSCSSDGNVEMKYNNQGDQHITIASDSITYDSAVHTFEGAANFGSTSATYLDLNGNLQISGDINFDGVADYTSTTRHDFFKSGALVARITNDRIYVYDDATVNNWTSIGADSTWGRFETGLGLIYMNKEIRVATGNLSSYNARLALLVNGTIQAYTHSSTAQAGTFYFYNPDNSDSQSGSGYFQNYTAICARTNDAGETTGNIAAIAWWTQANTDRHAIWRVWDNQGDSISAVNAESNAYVSVRGGSYVNASSEKFKTRIRDGRTEGGLLEGVLDGNRRRSRQRFKQIGLKLYDNNWDVRNKVWAGCDKHVTRRECQDAECESADEVQLVNHDCDLSDWCSGTNEAPCWDVEQHIDRVGPIAEELIDLYPKAIDRRIGTGEAEGVMLDVLLYETINEVQHHGDDIDDVRDILAREILLRRDLERRLAALEPSA